MCSTIMNYIRSFTNFNDLKDAVEKDHPNLSIKSDESSNLAIIFNQDVPDLNPIEASCKSLIIERDTLNIIGTQYDNILYNNDALDFLKDKPFNRVTVQKCYEGTTVLVYYYGDKWFVSTRRCIDASNSVWIKGLSYRQMFDETALDCKLDLDTLDKNYCYHFILVHHKNKNIVNYANLTNDYKEMYHVLTIEKITLKEHPDYVIPNQEETKVKKITEEKYENIDKILDDLRIISQQDEKTKCITTEGFIIKYYLDDNLFRLLKLQTNIYKRISKLKPNNSNINQAYLELYQKDKLKFMVPYFTKYKTEVLNRVHKSMKTLSREILDLYHITRHQKNPDIYNSLPGQYKTVLYNLHGMYLKKISNNPEKTEKLDSINVHDVYHHLKSELKPNELRQLFYERLTIIESPELSLKHTYFDRSCLETMTQSHLMFRA